MSKCIKLEVCGTDRHMSQSQSALADMSSYGGGVKYGGPMDVAKQVLRSEGGMIGLFKGLAPTFAREVPGNAAI
ncbi:hypothetical protein IFM89_010903 [Coptis chinensis]|uniref:Uncharacterized protein n=1 Tax=Coptis chinensis TaxID=261450 RepID=A0A835M599_9MAGN|nr:hypothetical protein IFM89_010903 [Coptis chinensis]